MKIRVVIIVIFFLNVQNVLCQKLSKEEFLLDLDFTYQNLKESISYKTQKNKHEQVELKYLEIKNNASDSYYVIDACAELHGLVDVILDLHNSVFTSNVYYSLEDLQDTSKLDTLLKTTEGFYHFSKYNLDRLQERLRSNLTDSIEGIYYVQGVIKIGIIKCKNRYLGIILESQAPSWKAGEIMAYIIPEENNCFKILAGTVTGKQLSQVRDYYNGDFFVGSNWSKEANQGKYYFPNQNLPLYFHQNINNQTDYLRVGSFQLSQLNNAIKFYEQVKEKRLPKNLIIDLRNNYGGNDKSSNPLLKMIKKYKGKAIILTNYSTVSNAEQFTLRASKLPNVTVMGDRTRGMLTYGINYPPKLFSPSGVFKISFTDLNDDWKEFIKYEGVGITPEIYLSNDKNWIDQVLEMLN